MDDGSIDPYQPNTTYYCLHGSRQIVGAVAAAMPHCGRLAGGRADWVARGNRIEFPSTERGKRQECGGLDSECMCVYVQ